LGAGVVLGVRVEVEVGAGGFGLLRLGVMVVPKKEPCEVAGRGEDLELLSLLGE
jgi:hypothetical protein